MRRDQAARARVPAGLAAALAAGLLGLCGPAGAQPPAAPPAPFDFRIPPLPGRFCSAAERKALLDEIAATEAEFAARIAEADAYDTDLAKRYNSPRAGGRAPSVTGGDLLQAQRYTQHLKAQEADFRARTAAAGKIALVDCTPSRAATPPPEPVRPPPPVNQPPPKPVPVPEGFDPLNPLAPTPMPTPRDEPGFDPVPPKDAEPPAHQPPDRPEIGSRPELGGADESSESTAKLLAVAKAATAMREASRTALCAHASDAWDRDHDWQAAKLALDEAIRDAALQDPDVRAAIAGLDATRAGYGDLDEPLPGPDEQTDGQRAFVAAGQRYDAAWATATARVLAWLRGQGYDFTAPATCAAAQAPPGGLAPVLQGLGFGLSIGEATRLGAGDDRRPADRVKPAMPPQAPAPPAKSPTVDSPG
jgi:hypothetical protein